VEREGGGEKNKTGRDKKDAGNDLKLRRNQINHGKMQTASIN